MKVRLTDWSSCQGIFYTTAFRWAKAGKIPGLHQAVSGRIFVEVESDGGGDGVILYGRVSSVQDFVDAVTSMCARIYGRRPAANRARWAVTAASVAP